MCPKDPTPDSFWGKYLHQFEPSPNDFVRSINPPSSPHARTSEDGSTPSPTGTHGPPSPSELRHLRELSQKLMVGPELAPVLTGPLTISGSGTTDWEEDVQPLRSSRSKKVGEDGYIFTLYLDRATRECLAKHFGAAGSIDTVGLSFSVSIPLLEQLTT